MKILILHLGLHKTATTSIQLTLSKNRNLLQSEGYYYPVFQYRENKITNHSIPIFSLFTLEPEEYHVNTLLKINSSKTNKVFQEQFSDTLSKNENIIFSGEGISLLPEERLRALKSEIENFGFTIRVIVNVRSPYKALCSQLQQYAKRGVPIDQVNYPLGISDRVIAIRNVFPNAIFCNFEDTCKHTDGPVGHFLEKIGIIEKSEFDYVYANTGIGNKSTRLISYINSQYPSIINNQLNEMRESCPTLDFNFDDDRFLLTAKELLKFRNKLDSDNEKLKHLLGDNYCDRKYPTVENDKISNEEAIKLTTHAHCLPCHIRACIYDYLKTNSDAQQEILNRLFISNEHIDATLYRDTALLWEKIDLEKACYFMWLAHKSRPSGPFIKKKLNEYLDKINPKKNG